MIISLNWIKEFVDLSGIEVDELTKRFGLSTAEIESVTHVGGDLKNIVVAEILSVENHPQSNHLHVLKVDDGSGTPVQVVCSAPNVRVGLKTFFCRVGGQVKDMKIKPVKMVGVDSNGMCCGGNELGIEADTSGIVELDQNAKVGTPIEEMLPVEDVLIEIDNKSLTNRPDLWGHYGIAREFAAIFNRPLKPLELDDLSAYEKLKKLNIKVETKNCFRYSGIAVENILKKVASPLIKLRLNYCGMRDINLLADLTNYIMLELGQPMHAFDHAKVGGITVIENTKPLEMETLEHTTHTIEPNSVVICDEKREPIAIAGIKGGLKDSIGEDTNSLLLESACFDSMAIRKTSRKIGLITDASLRYEKSLDPELTKTALARLLYLLKQIDSGVRVSSSFTDVYNFKYPTHTIKTDADFISRRGGVELSAKQIADILTRLGFTVKVSGQKLEVIVPSWRGTKDVSIKEDLVEEVFRMYGYDNIKSSTMSMPLTPVDKIPTHELEYEIKLALASKFGLNEVHSYVWNYADFNKSLGIEDKPVVHLMDASKSGQSGLRVTLTPTLLKFADENKNKFAEINIFEIGRTFDELDKDNLVIEKKKLSIVLASADSEKALYFKLKEIAEYVGTLAGCELSFDSNSSNKILHPINSCAITSGNLILGSMGILHPTLAKKIDKRKHFAALELDVNKLLDAPKQSKKIVPTSKFQAVSLDFNFVAAAGTKYATLENAIKNFRCNYLLEYGLKDVYTNDGDLKDKISYTINVTITPKDKTLTATDIEKFSAYFIKTIEKVSFELRK